MGNTSSSPQALGLGLGLGLGIPAVTILLIWIIGAAMGVNLFNKILDRTKKPTPSGAVGAGGPGGQIWQQW